MKEYGGYLPIELPQSRPYYDYDSTKMLKCNSGLTAIFCALKILRPKRIHIPHFICDTVPDMINNMGIDIQRYYITENFEPVIEIAVGHDECILIVNYFGICNDNIKKYADKFSNVLIDNTQSFFTEPIFRNGVFNIYSCRKFIGVPDGGYLISENISPINLPEDRSSDRSLFLLKQYEYGINAAYSESLSNYDKIKVERKQMSGLTQRILSSVDYDHIIKRRQCNFDKLHEQLNGYNRLNFSRTDDMIPLSYPLLCKNIKKQLIENKIYVPTLWAENLNDRYENKIEFDYSDNIVHLPIDQRYDEDDMSYIAGIVKKCLNDHTPE